MRHKSSLLVLAIVLLVSSRCQSLEDRQPQPPYESEDRSLLNFGFFKKIFRFFGWGEDNRKTSREFPIYRRQELLPYEIQNSSNRRSEFEPSPPDISYLSKRRKWPISKRNKKFQRKSKAGIFKRFFSPQKKIATPIETYKPPVKSYISSRKKYDVLENFVDESIYLEKINSEQFNDANAKSQFDTINTGISSKFHKFTSPKVETRKPAASVFNNGIKIKKFSSTKFLNHNKSTTHSKFELNNHGKSISSKSFIKNNPKNVIRISKSNNLVSPSKNFVMKKEKDLVKLPAYEQMHPVHPYPYVQPDKSLQKVSFSNLDPQNTELGRISYFGTPKNSDIIRRRKKTKKDRGLFKNMSNMASNFFGNIFSRSGSSITSASTPEPYPLRRFQRNPPTEFIPPPFDIESVPSAPSAPERKSDNFFAPSPQQGFVSSDAFQPIFVPSYSMDSKLPNDVMKPLILPQRRNSVVEEKENTTTLPELIDFFS